MRVGQCLHGILVRENDVVDSCVAGRKLKDAMRHILLGGGRSSSGGVDNGAGGGDGEEEARGVRYGWLKSRMGEEEGRVAGPTDVELMHAVMFREIPTALVLVKMSVVSEEDNWAQVIL